MLYRVGGGRNRRRRAPIKCRKIARRPKRDERCIEIRRTASRQQWPSARRTISRAYGIKAGMRKSKSMSHQKARESSPGSAAANESEISRGRQQAENLAEMRQQHHSAMHGARETEAIKPSCCRQQHRDMLKNL